MDQRAVITIRLSPSLAESLRDEAWRRRLSLNQLCVEKLSRESDPAGLPLRDGIVG